MGVSFIQESKSAIVLVKLNQEGMELLSQQDYKNAQKKLKQAEQVIKMAKIGDNIREEEYYKLYSLTMNNLGCYYKKIFKPNVALTYLKLALKNEINSLQPISYIASTKLNICAILS